MKTSPTNYRASFLIPLFACALFGVGALVGPWKEKSDVISSRSATSISSSAWGWDSLGEPKGPCDPKPNGSRTPNAASASDSTAPETLFCPPDAFWINSSPNICTNEGGPPDKEDGGGGGGGSAGIVKRPELLIPGLGFDRAANEEEEKRGTSSPSLDSPFVSAADGSLTQMRVDMYFPGGAAGFQLGRTYRSSLVNYHSFIGAGWELNVLRRLNADHDANGKPLDFWVMNGSGLETGGYFPISGATDWYDHAVRDDQYLHIKASPTSPAQLVHYLATGDTETYSRLDAIGDWYHLTRSEDMWGNGFDLEYTDLITTSPTIWTLEKVIDDLGREFLFHYDATHGRLNKVEAWSGATSIGAVDYTYLEKSDGTIVLTQVDGLDVPREGAGGSTVMVRASESYLYEDEENMSAPYLGWRLSGVVNGEGEQTVGWKYYSDPVDEKVKTQTDRPGGTNRLQGVHAYTYLAAQTEYVGPDGEEREFLIDSSGRISGRVEHPDSQTSLTTTFIYDTNACSGCSHIKEVHRPDQSKIVYQMDGFGNVTTQWDYPPTGSSLTPRVERWEWSNFAPSSGQMRMRLLEHELQRDADPIEDPGHPCNHPSCDDLLNVDGHHVNTYNWSGDEKTLDSVDFGSMQSSTGSSPAFLSRRTDFAYFTDGRLQSAKEIVDNSEASRRDYTIDPTNNFILTMKVVDTPQGEEWVTTYSVKPGTYLPDTETGPDGSVTRTSVANSGLVYKVEEDVNGSGAARTTDLWYDDAGRLVKTKMSANDGTSEQVLYRLDESGFPFEIERTALGGPARLTKLEFSLGGLFLSTEDWRGWKQETVYGMGSLQLPIEEKENLGAESRTIWKAGDGGADPGYDNLGRLTSSRNVAGWKSYVSYNDRGKVKSAFQQTDTTHYAAEAYFYDVRGFLQEKEVGSLDGDPLSPSLQNLTWLEHIVYTHNLFGHLLGRAVYESGATNEARLTRLVVNGRGDPVRRLVYQGDRPGSGTPVPVVEEFDYDALSRILQVRSLESPTSAVSMRILDAWYDDALRKNTYIETMGFGGPQTKVEHEFDALQRLKTRTQSSWTGGTWGSSRSWQYVFDGFDNPISMAGPLGNKTEWEGNDLGQMVSERTIPHDGSAIHVTSYIYDSLNGTLASVTDAAGKTTQYGVFPEWLRTKKVTHPDGRTFEVLEYDDLGRRTKTLDSRGIEHQYTYDYQYLTTDAVIKPTSPAVPGPDAMTWVYDRSKETLTKSRVWESGAKVWESTYSHSDLKELVSETQGIGSEALNWSWAHGYAGELLSVNYPAGLGIDDGMISYDAGGRVSRIQYSKSSVLLADDAFTYDGLRVHERSDAVSGIDVALRFDGYGRMDRLEWSKDISGSPVTLDGQERALDLADRVTSRQRLLDTTGSVFVHDGYGRMKDWYKGVASANSNPANTVPTTWVDAEHYTLNEVFGRDQIVDETNGGGSSPPRLYVENDAHFYTSVDGQGRTEQNGRLNGDGVHYFGWDAWGRLVEVKEQGGAGDVIREHSYDAEGRRVRTEVYDQGVLVDSTRFAYWGARLAASFVEGATWSDVRTYGYTGGADGESFVEVSASGAANGSYALARDFQGSILALIDRSTGTVVERYRYGAFGDVAIEDGSGQGLAASAYGNDRFFLGKPFDAVVGIYDLRARWYDPESGSFLGPDPLGAVDSWNLYQYGLGTPGTWMDPFGLQFGSSGGPDDVKVIAPSNHVISGAVDRGEDPMEALREVYNEGYALAGAGAIAGSLLLPAIPVIAEGLAIYEGGLLVAALERAGVSLAGKILSRVASSGSVLGRAWKSLKRIVGKGDASGGSVTAGLAGLKTGKNKGVKVVDSEEELKDLFSTFCRGGRKLDDPNYPGDSYELPDGTWVGYRGGSKSGGATIDTNVGGKPGRVHVK